MSFRIFKTSTPCSTITTLPDLGMDEKHIEADFKRYYSHRLGRDES
jgi:starch phosphorylase